MTRHISIAFILWLLCSCNEKPEPKTNSVENNSYLFDGIINGMDSGWLFIGHHDTTGKNFSYMDSSKILNGSFRFTGTISGPDPCVFIFKNGANSLHLTSSFILDKGHTTGIIYKDSMEKSIITGSASQDQYQTFMTPFINLRNEYFETERLSANGTHDSISLQRLKAIQLAQTNLVYKTIKANPNSIVSAFIAYKYLPLETSVEDLQKIYNSLQDKNNYYSREILRSLTVKQETAFGHIAPEFSIRDNQNKLINNRTFGSKYFLIDFWASWCIPCRAENPNLLKAYNLFNKKGFDVISISLDENKLQWEKAVKQDKLPWTQACDLKGTNSPVVISYGINTIPMNYLIDPNGKIVGKNLRGEQLMNILEKYVKE